MRTETGLGRGFGETALRIPCPKALPCDLGEHLDIPSLGNSGLVAFYFPGKEEAWDTLCGSAFLGNFYDLGPEKLELEAPNQKGKVVSFSNAEAAFQALKFWSIAEEFAGLSGQEAFVKKRALGGYEDWSYAGYGSNWEAMLAVLRQKFKPGSRMAHALWHTADAFLLEHNSVTGRDVLWSDNGNGEGRNWLGLQLMLVRADLSTNSSKTAWAAQIRLWFGADCIGMPETQQSASRWRQTVRRATACVHAAVEEQRRQRLEQSIWVWDWDFAVWTALILLVVVGSVAGSVYYLGEARSYEPPNHRLQGPPAAPSDWLDRSYEPPNHRLQGPPAAPSDWLDRSYELPNHRLQGPPAAPSDWLDRSYEPPNHRLQGPPAAPSDWLDRSYEYPTHRLQAPTSTTTGQSDRSHKSPSNPQLKLTRATHRPVRTHNLDAINSPGEAHAAIRQGSAAVRTPSDQPDADTAVQPVTADLGGTHAETKDTASGGILDSKGVVCIILGLTVLGALIFGSGTVFAP